MSSQAQEAYGPQASTKPDLFLFGKKSPGPEKSLQLLGQEGLDSDTVCWVNAGKRRAVSKTGPGSLPMMRHCPDKRDTVLISETRKSAWLLSALK